jgi:hypothetical protein
MNDLAPACYTGSRLIRVPAYRGELRGSLRELLVLHYRYRFDPEGLSRRERHRLREEASSCSELLQSKSEAVTGDASA